MEELEEGEVRVAEEADKDNAAQPNSAAVGPILHKKRAARSKSPPAKTRPKRGAVAQQQATAAVADGHQHGLHAETPNDTPRMDVDNHRLRGDDPVRGPGHHGDDQAKGKDRDHGKARRQRDRRPLNEPDPRSHQRAGINDDWRRSASGSHPPGSTVVVAKEDQPAARQHSNDDLPEHAGRRWGRWSPWSSAGRDGEVEARPPLRPKAGHGLPCTNAGQLRPQHPGNFSCSEPDGRILGAVPGQAEKRQVDDLPRRGRGRPRKQKKSDM